MPTMQDPIAAAELDAISGVAARCRWFVLGSVVLASLMLLHVFLERASYQRSMLEAAHGRRESDGARRAIDQARSKANSAAAEAAAQMVRLDEMKGRGPVEPHESEKLEQLNEAADRAAREFGELKLRFDMTTSALQSAGLPQRKLPLLDFDVPANDFLPIAGFMLAISTVGTWLSVRQLRAALRSLSQRDDPRVLAVARLHFVFTSGIGKSRGDRVAGWIQTGALLLPAIATFVAGIGDVAGVIGQPAYVVVGPVGVRAVALGGLIVTTALAGRSTLRMAVECDGIASPPGETDAATES